MNFNKLLSKISLLFLKTKVTYMLVGGFAVSYWGYPRQSLDIDLVTDLTRDNITLFLKQAKSTGFILNEKEIKIILKIGNRFVMDLDDFRIDCWLPKSKFDFSALQNRKKKKLFGHYLYLARAEDLILSKLKVGRARDIEDIKTILLRQGRRINKAYLNQQAISLDMVDFLNKIFSSESWTDGKPRKPR